MVRVTGLEAIVAAIDRLIETGGALEIAAAIAAAKPRVLEMASDHLCNRAAAKALTVKILNLLAAKHDLRSRALRPQSRPFGLTFDPANGCTLRCPGCVHSVRSVESRLFDWPSAMLSEQQTASLFRQFGPRAVQAMFCNYGEPLLNPATPRFVSMARKYLMQTMLSTSLSVRRFDAGEYVRSGLDYMILSIDGATQPVYERYRRNGCLSLVLDNIAQLMEARRRQGSRTPVLCWQFLAFEHNAHEIGAAIKLARQLGIEEFHVTRPFEVSWDDPAIRPAKIDARQVKFVESPDRGLRENWHMFPLEFDEAAIDAALEHEWDGSGTAGGRGPSCRWLYKNITIDAKGRILPCCGAPEAKGDLVFTNLGEDADPFNSPMHKRARLSFADPAAYANRLRVLPDNGREPYCVRCQWVDMQADIDSAQVANYLRAAGSPLLSDESIRMLSEW